MDVSYILDELNPIQREAVTDESSHSLILAGAGSGKTKVITHKVAWLSSVKGINPMSLLTVTFTNKAAKEMRGRIENILEENLNQMWCGTFHGIFHKMLKIHWQDANLIKDFSVIDSEDQIRVLKRVIQGMNLDLETWQPRDTQWFINKQKDEGRRKASLSMNATFVEEKMVDIMDEYQRTCDREGLVDFAEILIRSFELLDKNAELLKHYQDRFQHILVDEFQDTNEIQYLLLKKLEFFQEFFWLFLMVISEYHFLRFLLYINFQNHLLHLRPQKDYHLFVQRVFSIYKQRFQLNLEL